MKNKKENTKKSEKDKREKTKITLPLIGEIVCTRGYSLIGIFIGLIIGGILIGITGVNPFSAYASMFRGAFDGWRSFCNVLVRSCPLLLGGIGVAIGIKSGVWNTGIEGYMYLGGIGASIVAVLPLGLPKFIHIFLCLIVAAVFAGAWGAIPGYLRAYKNVNEVTSTIMLNYVAIYLTTFVVSSSPLADKKAFYPRSIAYQPSAIMSYLTRGTSLHIGPFIGFIICVAFYFILKYTTFGFRTRMLGLNPNVAQYAGTNSKKQIVVIMTIGAILGGISGAFECMGLRQRLFMEFVTGVGYESVAVALVSGGHPLGVIVSALFFSVLKAGGATMSLEMGVSSSMSSVIIALCVLAVIAVGVIDDKIELKIKNLFHSKGNKVEFEAKERV